MNGELPAARRGGARCCYPPVRVRSPYRKQRLGDLQQRGRGRVLHAPGAGDERANGREEGLTVVVVADSDV